ncbi:uncharacterized protein LOC133718921 isoform X1 [Rosa rugosa]|uniref:uncharacterized protein LOC133718921 isoform X1 n=1 Tax=Rosa rugosa TaxID=74645 RepID=UPI002B40F95C|nr:uncharacterized protein LOC133718921 isoform X1 [Rosa rugosa]
MCSRPRMRRPSSSVRSQSPSLGSVWLSFDCISMTWFSICPCDFISVTALGLGDRVYAKISRVDMEERPQRLDGIGQSQSGGLILEPIDVLLQRREQKAFTRVWFVLQPLFPAEASNDWKGPI